MVDSNRRWHIDRNAQGVSENAERGNDGISQVLRAMEDLNQTVTDVALKAERVSHLVNTGAKIPRTTGIKFPSYVLAKR